MIEITDGFTLISAGADPIETRMDGIGRAAGHLSGTARTATGVRVVLEFCHELSLPLDQPVTVRYDFAGDGKLREGRGIARPIRTAMSWGRIVRYHYRVSYWIAPSEVGDYVANKLRVRANPSLPAGGNAIRAGDPTPV